MQRIRNWERRTLIALLVVAVVLMAARIAMPVVVKRFVNDRLESIPGYTGNVDDIGISLVRGAYTLEGVSIYRQTGKVREPFVLARHIDFSVAWRELFRGKIVSDIFVNGGQLSFVKAETQAASQQDVDRRWQEVIKDLFPIDITHFEIRDGVLRYQDKTKEPHVDVFLKNMRLVATGLRNRAEESGEEFPAHIVVEGDSLGQGKMKVVIDAEPLAAQPHFHLRLQIEDVDLTALNDSLKGLANVDVSRGRFQMAAEMAGKDGGFQGYVKPFFDDLDFTNVEGQEESLGTRIWEKIVAGLAWLVKNKARDQVGTRIPFEGRFGDPQVGLFATIANLFRHGFVQAFNPTVEGSVEPANVLPSGKSADGSDVAEAKSDAESIKKQDEFEERRAGAPTGRPSDERKK